MNCLGINVQELIFQFLGGIGLFLFSVKYMGDGLQAAAGNRLRDLLDRFTTNPFMGVLAGMFITALIQSSTGTTALTVALVNSGFMTLRQAIGVIMGANIGTTMTAFIIGLDVGAYALPIMAVGALLLFFFRNKTLQSIGQIAFGFGGLFFGLELMSTAMSPLRSLAAFQELVIQVSNIPILGVVVGAVLTIIIQSSSATIGILQQLFGQGAIDLQAALPILFGDNIGTTLTAVIAAIGTTISARRAAMVHVLFNVIGTTIFLFFLSLYTDFIGMLQASLNLNPAMTIAFAHGIFNVTNTIMQFPFIGALAWLVTKIIPGKDTIIDASASRLNSSIIDHAPSIALGNAKEEVMRMGEYAKNMLMESYQFLQLRDLKHATMALQYEEAINRMDHVITDYLIKISTKSLTTRESQEHNILMDTIRDIERVGDHVENIIELLEARLERKVTFSDDALKELEEMFELTMNTYETSLQALFASDKALASKVLETEKRIDKMEKDLRKTHISRLNEGKCSGDAGILFVDIVSNLERIGDHAVNIAEAVLGIDDHELNKLQPVL